MNRANTNNRNLFNKQLKINDKKQETQIIKILLSLQTKTLKVLFTED